MDFSPAVDAMREAAHALAAGGAVATVAEQIIAVQKAQDAMDAVKATLLAELGASKAYEDDGASTLNAWVRRKLRVPAGEASKLTRAAATMDLLPLVGDAVRAGLIRADHVNVFTYGIKYLGLEVMREYQESFVQVAKDYEPCELFVLVKELRERLFPEDLEKKWLDGQDTEDIAVDAVPDGFHVTGYLNPVTGSKFKTLLDSVSVPHDADDTRTAAERRVQGFDDVLTAILDGGLPADNGVRPHVSVVVDADTFEAAAQHAQQSADQQAKRAAGQPAPDSDPSPGVKPAHLVGYGSIGPSLLMYLACLSDFTAFLVKNGQTQAQILNVGRTQRLATFKQRRGILVRQNNVCATPGCKHTHLVIHHVVFWDNGGPTDIDLMIGLCSKCHTLLHKGGMSITGNAVDGFTFRQRDGTIMGQPRPTLSGCGPVCSVSGQAPVSSNTS